MAGAEGNGRYLGLKGRGGDTQFGAEFEGLGDVLDRRLGRDSAQVKELLVERLHLCVFGVCGSEGMSLELLARGCLTRLHRSVGSFQSSSKLPA